MKSDIATRFRQSFGNAPANRQARIRLAYKLWRDDPSHPSLRFKKVHPTRPVYSARVDLDWRAPGVMEDDTLIRFWVGSHDDYDDRLRQSS